MSKYKYQASIHSTKTNPKNDKKKKKNNYWHRFLVKRQLHPVETHNPLLGLIDKEKKKKNKGSWQETKNEKKKSFWPFLFQS